MSEEVDDTAQVVARAGLRRRKIVRLGVLVLLIAGVGAGTAALFLKSALDGSQARAMIAEESSKAMETIRALQVEREELRGKVERLERENTELLSLKSELTRDVTARDEELARQGAARAELEDKLKAEIKSGDVSLSDDGGRLRVDLVDKILFDSGDATIGKRGIDVLTKVGAVLAGTQGKLIQVSGHTDDSPPTAKILERFPTNWELSTTRASNVVRFLQEHAGLAGKRLVAAGYGQFRPLATNANPAGRAKNRRIEILLIPEIEPVHASAATIAKAH